MTIQEYQKSRLENFTLTTKKGKIISVTENGETKDMDTIKIVIKINSKTTAELQKNDSGEFVLSFLDSQGNPLPLPLSL